MSADLTGTTASDIASGNVSIGQILVDTAIVATAGGVAAKLTGGKFSNGALTAAFANLYNKFQKTWDTHTNRRIATLHQKVQAPAANFINEVQAKLGIRLRVTQAYRSIAYQNRLYAQGRTTPGPIVTNARGGYSYHNYGLAIDVVEIRGGVPNWNTNWAAISKIGTSYGFTWGGNWTPPDRPHFHMSFGLSIRQLRQGMRP